MSMIEALTLNGDFRTGTAGDDLFTAMPQMDDEGIVQNTLQSIDTLMGEGGYDTLAATLVGRGGAAISPSLVDIENLSFRFVTDIDYLDLDLGSSIGIESVNVYNSILENNVDINGVDDIASFSFHNVEGNINLYDSTAANITITGSDSDYLDLSLEHNSVLASFDASTFTGDMELGLESVTSNANINTGSGDDAVYFDGEDNAVMAAGTSISTGSGEDIVSISSYGYNSYGYGQDYASTVLENDVTITMGDGEDMLIMQNRNSLDDYNSNESESAANLTIGNNVNIKMGADDDFIGLGSVNHTRNSNGGDVASVASVQIGENVSINTGAGNDFIGISAYAYASAYSRYGDNDSGEALALSSVNIGDGFNITTGIGQDNVNIQSRASAYGEDGSMSAAVVTFGDDLTIDTGNAIDGVYISGEDAVTFGENTTIDTGNGNDTVRIGSNGTLSIGAGSTFTMGEGDDILSMYGDDINGSDFAIDMGEGNDGIDIYGDLGDNVTITTGVEAGKDHVGIYGDAGDGLNINTGKGSDSIEIGNVGADAVIKAGSGIDTIDIHGNVGSDAEIRMGIGDDILRVNGDVADDSTIVLGDDSDAAFLHAIGDNVNIDLGEGTNELLNIEGNVGDNVTINTGVEAGKDVVSIYGDVGENLIVNTGRGQDTISIKNGEVDSGAVIRAGWGIDTVVVEDSVNAEIHVGAGTDTVTAGKGANDISIGDDADVDTLVYTEQSDSAASRTTQDTVHYFNADDDMIDLNGVVDVNYLGEFDTKEELEAALTGTEGEAGLVTGSDKLFVDVNGDGAPFDVDNDMSIKLDGVTELDQSNFVEDVVVV